MKKTLYIIFALILLATSPLLAGWSEPMRLTYRGNEINPQVVARHETVHVIWQQISGAVSYIRSTDNGLTWGPITDLTENGHTGSFPNLKITDEKIWAAWADNGDNLSIAISKTNNGNVWSNPYYKYLPEVRQFTFPCLDVAGDTLFLAYRSFVNDSTGLNPYKFVKSNDGGNTWSNFITIGHIPENASVSGQVLNYCGGNLIFSCDHDVDSLGGGPHITGYVSYDKGDHWSDPVLFSPARQEWALLPTISCNQFISQLAVGYLDYRYQIYAFYGDIFITLLDTEYFILLEEIQATNNHTAVEPSIDYKSNLLISAWSDIRYSNSERDEIVFNRSDDGGETWGGEQRLTNTYSWSFRPRVIISDSAIHVTWREQDTSGGFGSEIFYMRYIPDSSDIKSLDVTMPSSFLLSAYPNPFNSTTKITFSDNQGGEIEIYDISGRLIKSLPVKDRSEGSVIWDAKDSLGQPLASGIYIAKAKTTRGVCTAKLVYIK